MNLVPFILLFAGINSNNFPGSGAAINPVAQMRGKSYFQPEKAAPTDSLNNKSAAGQMNTGTEWELSQIDTFAFNAPAGINKDPATVADYLQKGCKNDMEKARAAFAWIANNIRYDDNAYNSGKIGDMSAPTVLKRKRAVCEGYANLYKAIAQAMGLEAEVIQGYAKAYGYHVGQKFTGTQPNHSWNAVKINGEWALLDVTWGAGHSDGVRGQLRSRKEFMPYWFNVNKYEFLFLHYPGNEQWMLIPQKLTLRQFEDMPYVQPPLFQLGFDAHNMLDQFIAKTLPKQLPEASRTKYHVKVLDFPLSATLTATDAATFSLICDEDVDIEFINPDPKYGVHMEKSGNKYTITMPLKKGDLQVGIRGKSSATYSGFIKYKVK